MADAESAAVPVHHAEGSAPRRYSYELFVIWILGVLASVLFVLFAWGTTAGIMSALMTG